MVTCIHIDGYIIRFTKYILRMIYKMGDTFPRRPFSNDLHMRAGLICMPHMRSAS